MRNHGEDLGIPGLTYKDSGVDVDAGDALVDAIKPLTETTRRAGVASSLGGFSALFDLKAAGFKDPVLAATTDGVGTKLKIAIAANHHATIGIDLVAMCVNDLVVGGAEPLFFLDYFATGKLDVVAGRAIIAGIAEGCRTAGCALVGGETAEMPGMYAGDDYDLAGFAVGACERGHVLTGAGVAEGDVVLGLASSGAHSNGFSLVRRIVEAGGFNYAAPAPFEPGRSLGHALLEPTQIYVKECLKARNAGGLKALAHITGGGFIGNIPRVLPDGLGVALDGTWPIPPVFSWLQREGQVPPDEMARTFNCGIGMVAVVSADKADVQAAALASAGTAVTRIGRIVRIGADAPAVTIDGWDKRWAR